MTTTTLVRTISGHVLSRRAGVPQGTNPSPLVMSNKSGDLRYVFLAFRLPAAVLQPANVVASAELIFRNAVAWSGTSIVTASRVNGEWNGSKLTWNNKPTGVGEASLTKANAPKNTQWRIDVTDLVKDMQAAGVSYGFRLTTNRGGLTPLYNYGNFVPKLRVTYYVRPGMATELSPSNNEVVSVPKPLLMVVNADTTDSGLTGIQVQLSSSSSWDTPDWDSGAVTTRAPAIDLADYPSAPSLAVGQEMYWRIRLRGSGNVWSPWSAAARFTYKPLGTLTITTPSGTVSDPTPPVAWTLEGATQSQYRVIMRDDRGGVLLDSGHQAGDDSSYASRINLDLTPGGLYTYEVRVWDTEPRSVSAGAAAYVSATAAFSYDTSSGVPPVGTLAVQSLEPRPFPRLTWTYPEVPDRWVVVRDGVTILIADGPDLWVDGTDFEFVDATAAPRTTHEWTVRAVVNGQTSRANPTVTGRVNAAGIWLVNVEEDVWLPIMTEAAQEIGMSEDGATHMPLGGRYGVRRTTSLRGFSGSIVGELFKTSESEGRSGEQLYQEFLRARDELTGRRCYLTLNNKSIPVVPFELTATPTPQSELDGGASEEDYVYAVSFSFLEVE